MTDRIRLARGAPALAALAAAAALAAPPALAAPATVTLRVEGESQTTFENQISSDGHTVTTASGGTHKCDGTNGGVNPTPGPTATAALDDAAKIGGFTWDGDWFDSFDDYAVSRIGPDSQTSSKFWGYTVNFQDPQIGGCQVRVREGDQVLWAYDSFGKPLLRLDGPAAARTGEPVTVSVDDGQDGSPEGGASVGGAMTGPDGQTTVQFDQPGIYRLKAERPGAIRSNALVLCVDPPGAEACTSGDRAAPRVRVTLPGRYASDSSRSRTIVLSWAGDDRPDGSGVRMYQADVREVTSGPASSQLGAWRRLAGPSSATSARFRGGSGRTYEFRVAAFDRAGNRSPYASGRVVFPIDDRDRRLYRLSSGWRRLARAAAWGRFVVRPRRPGASARVAFRGRRVALIGRRLPGGGRLRFSVDGRSRVLRLRGRSGFRRVLYLSAPLRSGRHTLRLTALGGGPVEVDAVAPLP